MGWSFEDFGGTFESGGRRGCGICMSEGCRMWGGVFCRNRSLRRFISMLWCYPAYFDDFYKLINLCIHYYPKLNILIVLSCEITYKFNEKTEIYQS